MVDRQARVVALMREQSDRNHRARARVVQALKDGGGGWAVVNDLVEVDAESAALAVLRSVLQAHSEGRMTLRQAVDAVVEDTQLALLGNRDRATSTSPVANALAEGTREARAQLYRAAASWQRTLTESREEAGA